MVRCAYQLASIVSYTRTIVMITAIADHRFIMLGVYFVSLLHGTHVLVNAI